MARKRSSTGLVSTLRICMSSCRSQLSAREIHISQPLAMAVVFADAHVIPAHAPVKPRRPTRRSLYAPWDAALSEGERADGASRSRGVWRVNKAFDADSRNFRDGYHSMLEWSAAAICRSPRAHGLARLGRADRSSEEFLTYVARTERLTWRCPTGTPHRRGRGHFCVK